MRKRNLRDISGPLWFKIDESARQALIRFQRRRYHQELNPPHEPEGRGINADLVVTRQDIRDATLPPHPGKLRGEE